MVLADVDVARSVQRAVNEFFAFIPELIAALVILVLGYFVAKIIGGLVARLLQRAGFDCELYGGSAGGLIQKITMRPAVHVCNISF